MKTLLPSIFFAAAAAFGFYFGSYPAEAAGDTYTIALAGPITGENASYGDLLVKGARLAIDQINAAGGVNGHKLDLQLADDQMDPKQSPLVAQRLAQSPEVLAVIGHFASTNTFAAMPIYNRVGVPVLSHSSSQKLSGISPWFFRLPVTNEIQALGLADYIANQLHAKRIVVMYGQSEGPQSLQKPFADESNRLGVQILDTMSHQLTDKDFAAEITKVKSLNPDLVYLNTFFEAGALIVKQAVEAGYKGPFIGSDAVGGPEFIKLAGPASKGVYVSAFWDAQSTDPLARTFVDAYRKVYNAEPEQYGAQAYAAVTIFAQALRQGATTREAIRQFLDKEGQDTGFATAAGLIKWDKNHDPHTSLVFLQSDGTGWALAAEQPH